MTSNNKDTTYKDIVFDWFSAHKDHIVALSNDIWELAEPMYEEFKSKKILVDELRAHDFKIIEGIKGLPTAFMAEWENGEGPTIGFLGEYDALPGLGYEISDTPIPKGTHGHGCGHNLLGVGSLASALAVRDAMIKLHIPGKIRYYGCPAEEDYGAKVLMTHEGLFDDVDAILRWHPQNFTYVSMASTLRFTNVRYKFHGKTAHTQTFPHLGRSALDAAILMDVTVNYLREHIPDNHIRISSVITHGGTLPTIVPAESEIWYVISSTDRPDTEDIIRRLNLIAQGISIATETTYDIEYGTACSEILANKTMSDCVLRNLNLVGPPLWTPEEEAFAAKLDKDTTPDKKEQALKVFNITDKRAMETALYHSISDNMMEGGIGLFSTDAGDPSYIAPMGSLFVASMPIGSSVHSWQLTVCSGMSIGHKAMITAGKTLALSALDALTDTSIIENAQEEFKQLLKAKPYINPLDINYDAL